MEKKIELPFGPWREIFSGAWSNYDITMSENPDKLILTIIFEKERDNVTGMVFILDKFYVAEGDPSRLSAALGGYNMTLEKIQPAFKKKYFAISSGPRYAKAEREEMDSAMQDLFNLMEDQSERANELCKSFEVSLTELKYAKGNEAEKLFAEPVLMPMIMPSRAEERFAGKFTAKTLLGKKSTGEKAEENVQSFLTTVVIGSKQDRKAMAHVILENCVLGGIITIIFDDDKSYERMATPNKNFDFKAFPEIQPIGVPLKNVSIPEVGINLNMLTPEMFREVIGIKAEGKDYLGKIAAELIDEVLHEGKDQLGSIADLEERLLSVKEDVKKFHIYRAVRMMKVLDMSYPGFFGGKVDLTHFISPYLKSIGSVVRIDTSSLTEEVKAAFIYSVLASIYKKYKEEMATKEVKVVSVMVDGDKIAPNIPVTNFQKSMLAVLVDCNKYGVGVCLGTEHENDLNPDVLNNATIKIEFVGQNEVAVKEEHSRPYRMTIRPNLSA